MGLAVARALADRGGWILHIIDINAKIGEKVATTLSNSTFHAANVYNYGALASAFQTIFNSSGRCLDFVFANAGVIEQADFYAQHPEIDEPPPDPDLLSIDVDLKGVILTSYLALHYFRKSPHKGEGANLIMTASCGSFYPADFSPMYTAAKLGFVRSIATHFHLDGIRVNAICPGVVETNLVGEGGWDNFPKHSFTPMEMVCKVVLLLVDGEGLCDANDKKVAAEKTYGVTVEICLTNYYIRTPIEFCDDAMRELMEATSVEKQKGGVIKN
ncbi:MAG: hypothetical protein Q9157_001540 [Trypethelium eluteriae]